VRATDYIAALTIGSALTGAAWKSALIAAPVATARAMSRERQVGRRFHRSDAKVQDADCENECTSSRRVPRSDYREAIESLTRLHN